MPGDTKPTRSLWRRWGWLVRWGGTVLGIAYVVRLVDLARVEDALSRVSLGAVAASIAIIAASVVIGAVRWRAALRAYGANKRPSLPSAIRMYYVTVFYNTYLPGAVGGDIVRGVMTSDSFDEHGATGALAVVFVERALGLFAVCALLLTGLGLLGGSPGGDGSLWWWSVLGGATSLVAVIALPLGQRIARFLPGPLARIAARVPSVVRISDFVIAIALSLASQLATMISGWILLRDLHPGVTFAQALLIVPAAAAASFLPITVGGAGAREAMFVVLCGALLGMSSADALAVSLVVWLTSLVVGAAGGILLLAGNRVAAAARPPAFSDSVSEDGRPCNKVGSR
jgi:uncharacterized membrane protein YbhN (UPF0104 family)